MLNSVLYMNIVTLRPISVISFAFYTVTAYNLSQQEEITSQDSAYSAVRLLTLRNKKKAVAYNLVKYMNVLQTIWENP